MNLGYWILIFTTACTAVAMAAYAPGVRRGDGGGNLRVGRIATYFTSVGLVIAAAYLWHLITSHQFQYDYVFRYSSLDMPFRYVFASFWGGQEGTFLLWAAYGGLLAVFLTFKAKQYEAPVLFFYLGINLFLMFMLLKRSPFAEIPIDTIPPDGQGLNPLLQDPWMTIHPPIMFFGFASLGIPAAYAMAALIKEDWDAWVPRAIPWTLFGVLSLGTGLLLGGYWAYSILGWGGFWGWDPVENSSLVPWLFAVALLHNQVIQMSRGLFRRANLLLSMAPFLLLTYSTFLTRSGVLADFSVHSFTDLGINQFLAAFMIVFVVGGLGLFVWKFRRIPVTRVDAPISSREYFLFLGALAFSLFAAFVLFGTSAPWYTRMWGPPANVQPEFYNRLGLPFAILIGLLMGMAPHMVWKRGGWERMFSRVALAFAASLVLGALAFFNGVREPAYLAMAIAALFATLSNASVVLRIIRGNPKAAGGYIAHVGMGFSLLGILLSSGYTSKETVVLPQDEEVMALGYGFTYMGNRTVENGRKNAYDVMLRTSDGAFVVSPTMYYSDFNGGTMKKPAIKAFLQRDVYVSPINHVAEPIEDRVESRVVVQKKQPQMAGGVALTLQRFETENTAAEDHNGEGVDVIAEIEAAVGETTHVLKPVLRTFADGHTEVMPAEVPGTGVLITLLGVDASGGRAQLGVRQPPTVLQKGETATIGAFQVHFEGFDVQMPTTRGRSVKVYALCSVTGGGHQHQLTPGVISRPSESELERIEAPVGRTGMNLVLYEIDPGSATAAFYVAPAPQEYLYAELSLKPFIILLWIGTAITIVGLLVATAYRSKLAGRAIRRVLGAESEQKAA